METTKENTTLVIEKLSELAWLYGAPTKDREWYSVARAVMQFVEDEEKLDWLIQRASGSFTRFPAPLLLRKMYCEYYPPADNLNAYQITQEEI